MGALEGNGVDNSIVLIGAGSTVFTPGLMADLVASPVFSGWTVHLVDLVADAAETMARLGSRMAAERGADLTFVPHVDRREALPGARFVTTTVAVGGAAGWKADLEVPARFGIAQTVGDTVGPGGVLRALRHVPELVAIGEDIAELAPDAQLINYSNPLTANVRAVSAATPIKVIGLCHGTMHTLSKLAADLDVPRAEIHGVFAGINHLCWLLDLRQGTADLYPRLRELVDRRADGIDAPSTREEGVHLAVSAQLLQTFGRYPAPGDRHVGEFFGWYLRNADGTTVDDQRLPWGLQAGRDATIEYIDEKRDLWDVLHAQAAGSSPLPAKDNQEAERLVSIAEALVTGKDHVELAVNLPNRGKISNLPDDAVVEVPAVVGAAGITGLSVGALPAGIAAVLQSRIDQQEITVQAALTGRRDLAIQALALDPLVPNPSVAEAILDAGIQAHGARLQQFAAVTR
ncbi:alpha-glucosidase/alpha-galactosidase [Microlunatus endophyticus]|uniref:Alpha-glucosidase/alpha-galactosidase n=1 Tax=Microlunatus endophyticus TaxID=1716077 RepID=A0A917RYK9_9ACTN|nr:alpha-glucosidase/alpha-galactosidase [Microlunatus endophyticus]